MNESRFERRRHPPKEVKRGPYNKGEWTKGYPSRSGHLVHGGHNEARRYRAGHRDMRRTMDRAIRDWQLAVIQDIGGAEAMNMFQNSLLDRATELLIILKCMPPMSTKREL